MLMEQARTLQCPGCKQLINTLMTECRYCGRLIDPQTAQAGADAQDRIHQACSDASYLRTAVTAMTMFYFVGWLPFIGAIGRVAFLFLLVAIPFVSIRWFVRVRNVQTTDPDFKKARSTMWVVIGIWAIWLLVYLLVWVEINIGGVRVIG
jgi:hypothetical protein